MTVALGIVASDGVLIAADTEETFGDWKLDQSKIHAVWTDGPLQALVTGSGTAIYIDGFTQDLEKRWKKALDPSADQEDVIGGVLRRFHNRHVSPFSVYPPDERPSLDMIVACAISGEKPRLFSTGYNRVVESFNYAVVGFGAPVARRVLDNLLGPPSARRLEDVVFVAAHAIYYTKNTTRYVGKRTEFRAIRPHDLTRLVPPEEQEMETVMSRVSQRLERVAFDAALGLISVENASKTITELREQIASLKRTIRWSHQASSKPTSSSSPQNVVISATRTDQLTVRYQPRTLRMHTVTELELDALATLNQNSSINLVFLGITVGAFLTDGGTLLTVPISSANVYAAFVATAIVTGLLSAYFGVKARRDYVAAGRQLAEMKRGAL